MGQVICQRPHGLLILKTNESLSLQYVGHKTQLSIFTGEVSSLTHILSNCVTGMSCFGKTEDSTLFFSVLGGNKYSL